MSSSESLPRREVTCDLVYFAAGERTGFTKAEPLAHGVKRGVLLSPSPRVRGGVKVKKPSLSEKAFLPLYVGRGRNSFS